MLSGAASKKLRKVWSAYKQAGLSVDDLMEDYVQVRYNKLIGQTEWTYERSLAVDLVFPLVDDESGLECGWGPFRTGACDPFIHCCVIHDLEYIKKEEGTQTKTRKQVDDVFYECMSFVAGDEAELKVRAAVYYAIVRSPIGWLAWVT